MDRNEHESLGQVMGWRMPASSWWQRLPVVRHVRALRFSAHYSGRFEGWVLMGISRGWQHDRKHYEEAPDVDA